MKLRDLVEQATVYGARRVMGIEADAGIAGATSAEALGRTFMCPGVEPPASLVLVGDARAPLVAGEAPPTSSNSKANVRPCFVDNGFDSRKESAAVSAKSAKCHDNAIMEEQLQTF